jgi:hypothetical protein
MASLEAESQRLKEISTSPLKPIIKQIASTTARTTTGKTTKHLHAAQH